MQARPGCRSRAPCTKHSAQNQAVDFGTRTRMEVMLVCTRRPDTTSLAAVTVGGTVGVSWMSPDKRLSEMKGNPGDWKVGLGGMPGVGF